MVTLGGVLVRTTDGRVAGRRGTATRSRLLEHLARLLATTPYRNVRVMDVAREAGTSPATFYQYFADVEQAVLVLAGDLASDLAGLADVARGDWRGDPDGTARALVKGMLGVADRHRPVLRVVELASAEGNPAFQRLRHQALEPVAGALAEAAGGPDGLHRALVLASVLLAGAARRESLEPHGLDGEDLVATLAPLVRATVAGA